MRGDAIARRALGEQDAEPPRDAAPHAATKRAPPAIASPTIGCTNDNPGALREQLDSSQRVGGHLGAITLQARQRRRVTQRTARPEHHQRLRQTLTIRPQTSKTDKHAATDRARAQTNATRLAASTVGRPRSAFSAIASSRR